MSEQPVPKVAPYAFPERYVLPGRPAGEQPALQDAHRQTHFLLPAELALFEQAMNLQLTVVAAGAKKRSLEAAALLGFWSRTFSYLSDACTLLGRASYASSPPLLRAACDCIAAQRSLIADGFEEYHEWLAAPPGKDREYAASYIDNGPFPPRAVLGRAAPAGGAPARPRPGRPVRRAGPSAPRRGRAAPQADRGGARQPPAVPRRGAAGRAAADPQLPARGEWGPQARAALASRSILRRANATYNGGATIKRMSNLITSRRLWLGLGGTSLFLGLFFWRTDLGELGAALAQANYWWVVPAVAIWFVSAAFRSLRWHYLLRRLANLSTRTLYPIVIIGYMANNLLPLRTGELVRAYVLGERHGVSKMSALGTIAVERVFDGVVLVGFLVVAGAILGLNEELAVLAIGMSVVFALLLALFVYVASSPERARRWTEWAMRLLPRAPRQPPPT